MNVLLQPRIAAFAVALTVPFAFDLSGLRAQDASPPVVNLDLLARDPSWTGEASRLVLQGGLAAEAVAASALEQAKEERWIVVWRLLRVLGRMGPDAFPVADRVAGLLDCADPETVAVTFETLCTISPPSFPPLEDKFNAIMMETRDLLPAEKKRILTVGRAAVHRTHLRSRMAGVPDRAVFHRLVGNGQPVFTMVACDVLAGPGFDQAADRGRVLEGVGQRLRAMVPTAVRATRSSEVRTQDHLLVRMATLLLRHAPKSKDANVARGYLMLYDSFPELRQHWARELTMQGPESVDALPAIAAYLEFHRDDAARNRCAVGCVVAIGDGARSVLPHLEKLRDTDDAELRPLVRKAIERLQTVDK